MDAGGRRHRAHPSASRIPLRAPRRAAPAASANVDHEERLADVATKSSKAWPAKPLTGPAAWAKRFWGVRSRSRPSGELTLSYWPEP